MVRFRWLAGCVVSAGLMAGMGQAKADLADGFVMQTLPIGVEGQFTACQGQVHFWTADKGYQVYDVASASLNEIGLPPNGVNSNGYGDSFGVLDKTNGLFYAATLYGSSDSDVYTYDLNSSSWLTPGKNGVTMVNAYGGQAHNGQLYVSGLAEPWNGGYGQANYIFAFDHQATPGTAARHDTLIETAGNSANLAVGPDGDIYYGSFSTNTLYHWTAAQIAGVTNDLYHGDIDTFLTLADAVDIWTMPGSGNGIAVDDAGHVFVAVNDFSSPTPHLLAMLDGSQPTGFRTIYSSDDDMSWFGPISIDGDFLRGATLYFSPSTFGGSGGLLAIQMVPEPSAISLIGAGLMFILGRRRKDHRITVPATAKIRPIAHGLPVAMGLMAIGGSSAIAGPYSPGKGGPDEAAFVDAGIAGFVGPAGQGVTPTATNGNYVNPIFKGWATRVIEYTPSDNVGTYGQNGIGNNGSQTFGTPSKTLGPVTGDNFDIVSLGDMHTAEINSWKNHSATNLPGGVTGPGTLTLAFDIPITNGAGADFAAFENGFVSNYNTGGGSVSGQMFAELGFVEVSTDGVNFVRFPSTYLNYPNASQTGKKDNSIDLNGDGKLDSTAYLTQEVSNIHNLVGKHANAYGISWGTPFDLSDLMTDPLVLDGTVNLNLINYVRIVDIPGDGTFKDSLGNSIYDAWVTWGSGGLDFEALGVIHQLPEPMSGVLMLTGTLAGLIRRPSRQA